MNELLESINSDYTLPDLEPTFTTYRMSSKLSLIQLALGKEIKDLNQNALNGVCTLLDDLQTDVFSIQEYCEVADKVLFPLHEYLKDTSPETLFLLQELKKKDPDGMLQRKFIKELLESSSRNTSGEV